MINEVNRNKQGLKSKAKTIKSSNYKKRYKGLGIIYILALILLIFSGCANKSDSIIALNTIKQDPSQVSVESNEAITSKITDKFIKEFDFDKEQVDEPIIFDLTNDGKEEIILVARKHTNDGTNSNITAIYNMESLKLIGTINDDAFIDNYYEVLPIKNPKFKNCLAIASGESGYFISVFSFNGSNFDCVDKSTEGQEEWSTIDADGDGFDEIYTLDFNENSNSDEDKYIEVTYKWDGTKYSEFIVNNKFNRDQDRVDDGSVPKTALGDTFKNEKQQYNIRLPKSWKVIDQTSSEEDGNYSYEDTFSRTNDKSIVIKVQTIDNISGYSYTSNDIVNTFLIDANSKMVKEQSREKVYINGYEGELVKCNSSSENSTQENKETVYMMCFVTGQKTYIISATGINGKGSTAAPVIKQSLLSFQVHESYGTTVDESGDEIGLD